MFIFFNKTMSILAHPTYPVLLVDDEKAWLNSLGLTLRANGISNIVSCTDSREVLCLLKKQQFSIVVLDLIMPYLSGEELLPEISSLYPELPVIILTGMDQVEIAVKCMRMGAFDYQTKVAENNRLVDSIQRAVDFSELRRENAQLKNLFLSNQLNQPELFTDIVTHNKKMHSIFKYMEAIAGSREPILITGETGTGKELVAKALHTLSNRTGEYVAVNIAGLDDTVFSDTLFGHTKGAYTGAIQTRSGLVAKAANGSLFIDEIGDLENSSQIKLLRLLQENEYLPLGSDVAKRTNARTIFATHKDIAELQNSANFRPDLFYRLRSHHIHLPPLRDRLDDLPILVDHFLAEAAKSQNKKQPAYPTELITLLGTYHFPGNIRELRSMIFDALSKHTSKMLSLDGFKSFIQSSSPLPSQQPSGAEETTPFSDMHQLPTIKEAGDFLVQEALKRANGNQSIAADILGLTRQALGWRLKKMRETE